MKHKEQFDGDIILIPETVKEAGLLHWLCARYPAPVTLYFNTWPNPLGLIATSGRDKYPCMLISKAAAHEGGG